MKNLNLKWFLLVFLIIPFVLKGQEISDLKIDGLSANAFIDNPNLVFSWKIISNKRDECQTAYQIMMVCNKDNNTGMSWVSTTKKINSANNINVGYSGTTLSSNTSYYWKVRIWNKDGNVSNWSKAFHFSMGLINEKDWKANWISASRWFTPVVYRPKGLEVSPKGGWADIDLAKQYAIDSVKIFADEIEQFPSHFKIEIADNLFFNDAKTVVDYTPTLQNTNGLKPLTFPIKNVETRFLRFQIIGDTSKKLDFTVRQLEVYSGGKNVALQKLTREYGTNWSRGHAVFLVDGKPNYQQDNQCPKDACPTTTAPIFRKQFTINKKIKKATLYYASLGMADVYINGTKIGNQVLTPRFSDYSKLVYYLSKDVTNAINLGQNVLGIILANGFYNPPGRGFGKRNGGNGEPKFILQTNIEFTDGSKKTIVSDESWKWSKSEVIFNDVWLGYTEDRVQQQTGWQKLKFNNQRWLKAEIKDAPTGKLKAFTGKGIEVLDTVKPIKISNDTVFFKNEIAGWPQIKLNGFKGQAITIIGLVEGIKLPVITFKLAEGGETVLKPNFLIFAGSNRLKIEGLKTPLKLSDVSILQVAQKLDPVSNFECSNQYFNKLFEVTKRTYQNYVYDIPADPAREKQGWTQDAQNMFNTASYLFDVENYYKNWWQDMADNQDEQGYIGSVVPLVNRQVQHAVGVITKPFF